MPQVFLQEGRWSGERVHLHDVSCFGPGLAVPSQGPATAPNLAGHRNLGGKWAGAQTAAPTLRCVFTLCGPGRTVLPPAWLGQGSLSSAGHFITPCVGRTSPSLLCLPASSSRGLSPPPSTDSFSLPSPSPHGCYFLLDPIN